MLIYFERHLQVLFITVQELKSVMCNGTNFLGVNEDQVPNNLMQIKLGEKKVQNWYPNVFFFFFSPGLDSNWKMIPCI